ncbi:unnamed protein product, partial [Brenthis ino]
MTIIILYITLNKSIHIVTHTPKQTPLSAYPNKYPHEFSTLECPAACRIYRAVISFSCTDRVQKQNKSWTAERVRQSDTRKRLAAMPHVSRALAFAASEVSRSY